MSKLITAAVSQHRLIISPVSWFLSVCAAQSLQLCVTAHESGRTWLSKTVRVRRKPLMCSDSEGEEQYMYTYIYHFFAYFVHWTVNIFLKPSVCLKNQWETNDLNSGIPYFHVNTDVWSTIDGWNATYAGRGDYLFMTGSKMTPNLRGLWGERVFCLHHGEKEKRMIITTATNDHIWSFFKDVFSTRGIIHLLLYCKY